ncbi:MAG: PQQ-dependent sugar dehydrogenase [Pseudomonadota bacterium]
MSGSIFLSGTDFSVSETDPFANISFQRTGDTSAPVTVEYEVLVDPNFGNPASTDDVATVRDEVIIPAGETSVTIQVQMVDDDLSEGTESFFVSLISVDSGALLFPRTARIDILDDENPEEPPVTPALESPYTVNEEVVYDGAAGQPIAFEFLPTAPTQMLLAEKSGLITLIDTTTNAKVSDVLDLRSVVNNTDDRGLMDIALHPDFENSPYLYAFYVVDPDDIAASGNAGPDGRGNRYSHVVRYELDADNNYASVVEDSAVIIAGSGGQSRFDISGNGAQNFTGSRTLINALASDVDPETGEYKQDYIKVDSVSHAGGSLAFGPDGALYIATGDGTSFGLADPRSVSVQDIDSLAGKILRVDPLTGEGLADNPFVDEAGGDLTANAAKVWQLGLRNPFSMGFDDDGQLFITNTGWTKYETVLTGGPGANFGWPWFEGVADGELQETAGYSNFPEAAEFYAKVASGEIVVTQPFGSFAHDQAKPGFQVQAITGADDVISSDALPESLQGYYIFTDVVQGEVFAINTDDRREVEFLYKSESPYAPVHFKQGPDGEIYFADLTGFIGKLTIDDPREEPDVEFDGSIYVRGTDGLTRDEAQLEAAALGGTLVQIDSQAEQDFIVDTFWENRAIAVDANDVATEGVWVNSDGEEIQYTNWRPGEPNNARGIQDYAWIVSEDGRWDDQWDGQSNIFNGRGWTKTDPFWVYEIKQEDPDEPELIGQSGDINVEQANAGQWHSVTFDTVMDDPIVVASVVTFNGGQPVHVRVQNVTETGFEFQMEEWEYLDGYHIAETISWIAVERGLHILEDGSAIEAGTTTASHTSRDVAFEHGFDEGAAVIGQVASENDDAAVVERITNVSSDGFDIFLQEQERADGVHAEEEFHWIAFETGTHDSFMAESVSADERRVNVDLDGGFEGAVLTDLQSTFGLDTASVRFTGDQIFVQEEQSSGRELNHTFEDIAIVQTENFLFA